MRMKHVAIVSAFAGICAAVIMAIGSSSALTGLGDWPGDAIDVLVVLDGHTVDVGGAIQAWSVELHRGGLLLVCVDDENGRRGYAEVDHLSAESVELKPGVFHEQHCEVDWAWDGTKIYTGPGHVVFTGGRPSSAVPQA